MSEYSSDNGKAVYRSDLSSFYDKASDIAMPVLNNARKLFDNIEKYLYTAPSMINLVKSSIPVSAYQAVFTTDQLNRLAEGSIKLMTDKEGRILANLVNTDTNRIFSNVELKEVDFTPDLAQAMTGFAMQMQLMMISEKLDSIQASVDYIAQGQENDRLAAAYGCRERLIQALAMEDAGNRNAALLSIAGDAINSRNILMQSQNQMISKINSFDVSFFSSLRSLGGKTKKYDKEIENLKVNIAATFGVSMVAAIAYEEINEMKSARCSVKEFSNFLDNTYIKTRLIERLDLMDPSPDCFWSAKIVPAIRQINKLPECNSINYLLQE